jgi:hypothetical protein
MNDGHQEPWRDNYQNALAALRMIRETIETLGPPGALQHGSDCVPPHNARPMNTSFSSCGRSHIAEREPMLTPVGAVFFAALALRSRGHEKSFQRGLRNRPYFGRR